ncbi:RNA-binding S4 domain-containing protein [Pseudomonadota bacterium]
MRLDKWLWAARFFKTRKLAVEAINGGKIHLNGQRTKPGKEIQCGSQLRIHKGSLEWEIEVRVLPNQRRPASEAALFYEESEESINKRLRTAAELRDQRAAAGSQKTLTEKPSKRNRRMIHRFTRKPE